MAFHVDAVTRFLPVLFERGLGGEHVVFFVAGRFHVFALQYPILLL